MRPPLLSVAAALLPVALAGCSADAGSELVREQVALPSPAGADSGEPFLSTDGEVIYMSWLEAVSDDEHELRFSRLEDERWTDPVTIARSGRFFVNWADFPSLTPGPDGTLWAHWLERGEKGGYDYGVRIVRSHDGGATWSEPVIPHDDRSPTEHGFVSTFPREDGVGFVWLDGRKYAVGPDGGPPTHEMTLRQRFLGSDGSQSEERLVDGRVCDCCQTASAMTAAGPVTVYRDRSEDEIRDIHLARMRNGAWEEGKPVHEDGWRIAGCPVNGPAVVARGMDVVVAWFTAAGDVPRVKVAFSGDGGRSFAAPVTVDDGNPAGRVDLLLETPGSVLVSWLERTGGEGAEVRLRRVRPDGFRTPSASLVASDAGRASGFPRMVAGAPGEIVLAWTDLGGEAPTVQVSKMRVAEGTD